VDSDSGVTVVEPPKLHGPPRKAGPVVKAVLVRKRRSSSGAVGPLPLPSPLVSPNPPSEPAPPEELKRVERELARVTSELVAHRLREASSARKRNRDVESQTDEHSQSCGDGEEEQPDIYGNFLIREQIEDLEMQTDHYALKNELVDKQEKVESLMTWEEVRGRSTLVVVWKRGVRSPWPYVLVVVSLLLVLAMTKARNPTPWLVLAFIAVLLLALFPFRTEEGIPDLREHIKMVSRKNGLDPELAAHLLSTMAFEERTKHYVKNVRHKALSWIRTYRKHWDEIEIANQVLRSAIAFMEIGLAERTAFRTWDNQGWNDGMWKITNWARSGNTGRYSVPTV